MPARFGLSGMASIPGLGQSGPIANKPVVQLPMLSLPRPQLLYHYPPLALAHHLLLSRK